MPDRFRWDHRRALSWAEYETWTKASGDAAQRVVQSGLLLMVWVDVPSWWGLVLMAVTVVVTFLVCVTAPLDR